MSSRTRARRVGTAQRHGVPSPGPDSPGIRSALEPPPERAAIWDHAKGRFVLLPDVEEDANE